MGVIIHSRWNLSWVNFMEVRWVTVIKKYCIFFDQIYF